MLRNAYLDGVKWRISLPSNFPQHCPWLTTTHDGLIKTSCKVRGWRLIKQYLISWGRWNHRALLVCRAEHHQWNVNSSGIWNYAWYRYVQSALIWCSMTFQGQQVITCGNFTDPLLQGVFCDPYWDELNNKLPLKAIPNSSFGTSLFAAGL